METFKCASHLERISSLHMRDDEYIVLSTHHIWMAWQAAERETARKCAEIARGVMHANNSSDDHYGDMVDGKYMAAKEVAHTIKAEFPGAWE